MSQRNPIAKALRSGHLQARVIPDKRSSLLLRAEKNDRLLQG